VRAIALIEFFANIYKALAYLPFLTFIVIWFLLYWMKRDKKFSTRIAIDITTVLLLGKVSMQLHQLSGSWFGFWVILFILLLVTGLIGRQQNDLRGFVHLHKIVKILSRIGFVVLSFFYVVLLIIGLF
jgi:hypothetical protein